MELLPPMNKTSCGAEVELFGAQGANKSRKLTQFPKLGWNDINPNIIFFEFESFF